MSRAGFSLIELLVALTLAALVLSGAAGVFTTATDTLGVLDERAERWEREGTARAWLGQALANVRMSSQGQPAFVGTSDELRFATSLWVSGGWLEPTDVTLRVAEGELTLSVASGIRMVLADSLASAAIDYLAGFGSASEWYARYESSIRPPVAVRVRLEREGGGEESLVFYIGDRG